MCKCGCNTCETKGPLLTEGKVKSLLSEGLQYHIDKKIPLFETVYRIGSDKHLSLIREARKMYSRNVIDLCEEDEALIKTHLGEFALYEGVSIPLDLPMLNESYDYDEVAQSEFGMDYDQLGSGEKEWVRDEIDNMSMNEAVTKDYTIVTYDGKRLSVNNKDIPRLKSGKDVVGKSLKHAGQEEWILAKGKWKIEESLNESDSNYPDFDLNKNIRYQDTSISSGMWRYTGKEQGGKGVYRNLNNGQILGFDRSDFDIFKNNLSSHFDISESFSKKDWDVKWRLPKDNLFNVTKTIDANNNRYKALQSLLKSKPKELKAFDDTDNHPAYDMSYDELMKWFKTLEEPINENEDKLLKIKQELEALRPGTISWIDDIFISSYDGSLQVELDYTLYPDEIKQLAQIAAKYGMELKYMTGKNATLVKTLQEKLKGIDGKECWKGYKLSGTKKKGGKTVDNCVPMEEAKKEIDEAEFKGKKVALGKPKRGGPKAYYVYVKDGDKVKKVTFGSGGLRAKIKNKEARNAFAARHNCKDKKDRTKAGYWSCNLPRYAPALGLGAKMNTFW